MQGHHTATRGVCRGVRRVRARGLTERCAKPGGRSCASISSPSTSTARSSDPEERVSQRNRRAIRRALERGVRVALVTGRGVDLPIRISRELGLEPAGHLLPRRADQRLRRQPDAGAHAGAAAIRQADGRVRRAATACRSRSTSRSVLPARRLPRSSWTTCSARIGARCRASTTSCTAHRRSSGFSAPSRSTRCAREFGDLPLDFRYEDVGRVRRVRGAQPRGHEAQRARAALRRLSDPARARRSRSATRATTSRCCAGPASASRWATRRPK